MLVAVGLYSSGNQQQNEACHPPQLLEANHLVIATQNTWFLFHTKRYPTTKGKKKNGRWSCTTHWPSHAPLLQQSPLLRGGRFFQIFHTSSLTSAAAWATAKSTIGTSAAVPSGNSPLPSPLVASTLGSTPAFVSATALATASSFTSPSASSPLPTSSPLRTSSPVSTPAARLLTTSSVSHVSEITNVRSSPLASNDLLGPGCHSNSPRLPVNKNLYWTCLPAGTSCKQRQQCVSPTWTSSPPHSATGIILLLTTSALQTWPSDQTSGTAEAGSQFPR